MKFRPVLVKTTEMVDNPLYAEKGPHKRVEDPFIKGATVWTGMKRIRKPLEYEGLFHCWGNEVYEEDQGCATNTVAIVERKDGTVGTCEPGEIQFMFIAPDFPKNYYPQKDEKE